jgi:hypothetical protein
MAAANTPKVRRRFESFSAGYSTLGEPPTSNAVVSHSSEKAISRHTAAPPPLTALVAAYSNSLAGEDDLGAPFASACTVTRSSSRVLRHAKRRHPMATIEFIESSRPTVVVACIPFIRIVGPSLTDPGGIEIARFDGVGWRRDGQRFSLVAITGPVQTFFSSSTELGPFKELRIENTRLLDARTGRVLATFSRADGSWLIDQTGRSATSISLN